jgi:predicted homoserine dehydrogenase-like protein
MIIVDTELKKRETAGKPLRVGMIGAGFMGRGLANQIINYTPGMTLAAISNRTVKNARQVYEDAGCDDVVEVTHLGAFEDAVRQQRPVVTGNPDLLCESEQIDILVEATGQVEFGAQVTMKAIACGKDMVLMNAELDGTVGPMLKVYADRAGVMLTGCDGDQPGVQINLYRFVTSMGLTPRVCGNIKGFQYRYRTPETQQAFAKAWGQTPEMVTSFADGTKISFEQAIVANATGMKVAQRGMLGYAYNGLIDDMTSMYDLDMLRQHGGIVEYALGALPSPGVYVFAESGDSIRDHYLHYGKLGKGPLYSFYVPYHLTILEVPLSLARVALLRDPVIVPKGRPEVDVVAAAKQDLKAGEAIDGLGGFKTYGLCENAEVVNRDRLLPMGIAEDARLKRDISRDQILTLDDVELSQDKLCVQLRREQDAYFV